MTQPSEAASRTAHLIALDYLSPTNEDIRPFLERDIALAIDAAVAEERAWRDEAVTDRDHWAEQADILHSRAGVCECGQPGTREHYDDGGTFGHKPMSNVSERVVEVIAQRDQAVALLRRIVDAWNNDSGVGLVEQDTRMFLERLK